MGGGGGKYRCIVNQRLEASCGYAVRSRKSS